MKSRLFQNVIAALILLIVSGVCFQVLVSHPADVLVGIQNQGYNDTTNAFIGFKDYQRECLQQFNQFPYWNPWSLLGMPWVGNPQASLFYPVNWIFFFLNAASTISWVLVLHHWWAGWGAYLLGRKYRLNFFSALLSGIVFLAAPYFVAKTGEGHFTSVTQIAWFPWILYAYELLRTGSKKAVPFVVIVISLAFFCGHVQELYYLLLFLTAAIIIESILELFSKKKPIESEQGAVTELEETSRPGLWIKGWLTAGLLTAGLVAIDLIPVFIYTKQAVRSSGIDLASLSAGSLNAASLLQLIDPFVWGNPNQYTGPGTFYWEAICSFGCLPLLLAIVGVLSSFQQRIVIRLTLIGLIAFLLAFGPALPFYKLFYQLIPGASMFRIPGRQLWICTLVVAMLAGFGSQWISLLYQNSKGRTMRLLAGIAVVAVLPILIYLIFKSAGSLKVSLAPDKMFNIQAGYLLTALLGISIAIFLTSLSRKAAFGGLVILCLICTGELSVYSNNILCTIPQSSIRGETEIVQFLKNNLGEHRVLADQHLLSDREAWKNQLLKVQGYEPVPLVRLGLLAAATFDQPNAARIMAGFDSPQLEKAEPQLLDLMSIKYAVLRTSEPVKLEGWKTVLQGQVPAEYTLRGSKPRQIPFQIIENQNPLPRAYLVGQTRALQDEESSKKIVAAISKVKPRAEVLLRQDVLPKGDRQAFQPATILENGPNLLSLQADLDAPGYLVLSDIYYPGWTARLGQQELPVLPADFSLRAIPLPPGQHQVQLSFVPPGFQIGRVISLTALAILCILLVKAFRSDSKPQAE